MLNHMVKEITNLGKLVKCKKIKWVWIQFHKTKSRRIYELRISEILKAYHKIKFSFTPLPIEKVDFSIGEKWNDF